MLTEYTINNYVTHNTYMYSMYTAYVCLSRNARIRIGRLYLMLFSVSITHVYKYYYTILYVRLTIFMYCTIRQYVILPRYNKKKTNKRARFYTSIKPRFTRLYRSTTQGLFKNGIYPTSEKSTSVFDHATRVLHSMYKNCGRCVRRPLRIRRVTRAKFNDKYIVGYIWPFSNANVRGTIQLRGGSDNLTVANCLGKQQNHGQTRRLSKLKSIFSCCWPLTETGRERETITGK